MQSNGLTRRQTLVRAAAAAASISMAATILSMTRRARAEVDPPPDPEADNAILNSLLTAEYDAILTYQAGGAIIASDAETPTPVKQVVTAVALHFLDQHEQHRDALIALIEANGGEPAEEPEEPVIPDSFPNGPHTPDVIKLASDKEQAAAHTYILALKTISTQAAAKLITSIGGTETQHFVVLRGLADGLIAPTESTLGGANSVVPAGFILDNVGPDGAANLENNLALDALLALDEAE